MLKWPNRDPEDVMDYGLDGWLAHLGGADFVVSATWSVSPEGVTLGASAIDATGDVTSVWVSGGEAGTPYTITCHAVTAAGRRVDRSAKQFVTHR